MTDTNQKLREAFEAWAIREGYSTAFVQGGHCSKGLPVYKDTRTHAAWWAWQARASLSAGDAVDAQRYRWLRDESYSDIWDFGGCYPRTGLDAAIDAAIRALKD